MSDKRDDRLGGQSEPVPNDGSSMHDLVCADLWRLGAAGKVEDAVIADLQARKQFGLDKYGSLLQTHNGRDAALDLYEELQDATVYARQLLEESGGDLHIDQLYAALLAMLVDVRRMRDVRS